MDVTQLFQIAKDQILESGDHPPTIIFEFDDNELIIGPVEGFPESAKSRKAAMFTIGRIIGVENPAHSLKSVAFVGEMWVSMVAPSRLGRHAKPSDDPNRTERLTMINLEVLTEEKTKHSAMYCNLIRDGQGKLVDLGPTRSYDDTMRTPLLIMALAGFLSRKYNDEELMKLGKGKVQPW